MLSRQPRSRSFDHIRGSLHDAALNAKRERTSRTAGHIQNQIQYKRVVSILWIVIRSGTGLRSRPLIRCLTIALPISPNYSMPIPTKFFKRWCSKTTVSVWICQFFLINYLPCNDLLSFKMQLLSNIIYMK